MINQYGYHVVKKKFSEVDYKVNYFFKQKYGNVFVLKPLISGALKVIFCAQ